MPNNYLMSQSSIQKTLFFLFAFSGFSGLIYESIWTHYLKLFLGCAAYAQTLVLVIFMGGMAVGAWWTSRLTERIKNLLIFYAIVEALIGLMALVFHNVFVYVTDISYSIVLPSLNSLVLATVYKWGLSSVLILPQTILLGATFPLMSAGLIRLFPEQPGKKLALLYFFNSIGAVAGLLISGYVLISWVGLPGTILTAGLINIIIALCVWIIVRSIASIDKRMSLFDNGRLSPSKQLLTALLLCSCLTGASSFLYEIGWIRMLSLVLGSSTHSFELMLSAFILGLALGGYWIKRKIDVLSDPLKTLGVIQVSMGGFALITLLYYGQTIDLMGYIMTALSRTEPGYLFFNIFSQGLSLMIMLPATICAGMTLPIITYYLITNGYGEKSIGQTYAVNTIGAIVGVFVAVQLVMPFLGLKYVVLLGAVIDVLLGFAFLWHRRKSFGNFKLASVTIFFLALFSIFAFFINLNTAKMASGVFRTGQAKFNGDVIFHKDGKTASVAMLKKGTEIALMTNGKPDGSINHSQRYSQDEPTQILIGALSWAYHDKAKNVATIGMGTGTTGHVLLTIPYLDTVDTIEIEPAILESSKLFGQRVENIFKDPRSHIYIEDAKAYFSGHGKRYDLIISEPSNPWVSGVAGLFSKEFYQLIKNYLANEGLFIQWLQLYEISPLLVASVMKAISVNFEDYEIYSMTNGDMLIIAGKNLQSRKPSSKLLEIPAMKKELARIGITNMNDLFFRHLGSKKLLDPLFQSYSITPNSDFFPVLDLNAVQNRFMMLSTTEITQIKSTILLMMELGATPPVQQISGAITAAEYMNTVKTARQADAIYNYYLNGKNVQNLELNSNTLMALLSIETIYCRCIKERFDVTWMPAVHYLFQTVIPYLSSKQMDVIWKDLQSAPCYANLPDNTKDWLELYKAVSDRHSQRAFNHSLKLLPQGVIRNTPENRYILSIMMMTSISLNEQNQALKVFNRYENFINPPLALRLLWATISQQAQNQADIKFQTETTRERN